MLSLNDVLDLPVVRRALPEVVVGEGALDREIRWAHVIEMPDPDDLLKGGELVLTTGLGRERRIPAAWTASLVEQGMAALAVELGSSWRDVPVRGRRRLRPGGRAGHRVPPAGALHRDHRGGPRRGRQRAVRAAGARGGDPPALHRADPARARRARDPRRAVRGGPQPGGAGGRERVARLLRVRAAGRRSRSVAPGPTCTAPRRAGRPPRACSPPTCACTTPPGGGCWRCRWRTGSTTSTASPWSAPRWPWRSTCSASSTTSSCARARAARSCPSSPTGAWRRPTRAAAPRRWAGSRAPARGALLPVVAAWRAPAYAARRGMTWTRLSGDLRSALTSTGLAVLLGPRDLDLLMLFALGARGYDAALAEHIATLFHGALDRHGLGPATRRWRSARPPTPGRRAGQGLRRVRRSAGAATSLPVARWHDARRPGLADLLHDLRDTPGARDLRRRAARPAARATALARAAGDAGGLPGGGRSQGRGRAGAAPRAPVAVPAPAPHRGGARRLAGRRGRRPRPAPRGAPLPPPRCRSCR